MTYFKPETCQLLEKLGLTIDNPQTDGLYWWWAQQADKKWILVHGTELVAVQLSNYKKHLKAYCDADIILSAENAKKLFPDVIGKHALFTEKYCTWCGHNIDPKTACIKASTYEQLIPLLYDILKGEDIEPLIAEAAKKRLEGE